MLFPRTSHLSPRSLAQVAAHCLLLLGVVVSIVSPACAQTPTSLTLIGWGRETLAQIDRDFWMNSRHLYAEDSKAVLDRKESEKRQPAFMWSCGVQITALAAATQLDRIHYLSRLKMYAAGLDAYWQTGNGIGGYDVLPVPKDLDRYYDDNAWIVLGMIEVYGVTGDLQFLSRAEKTAAFVLSGEDSQLGGGLYWRESDKKSKNTCTNGPAIVGVLRLYQITRKPAYLETAKRLYAWVNSHLQDKDGLYWDNINLKGEVSQMKFTYNTALMLRANVEFYRVTKDPKYIAEASRIAYAALQKWFAPDGGVHDGGRFAHLLVGALIELNRIAPAAKWRKPVEKALVYVHDHVKDPEGRYPDHWDRPQTTPLEKFTLLDQSSVARAYLEAALPFPTH